MVYVVSFVVVLPLAAILYAGISVELERRRMREIARGVPCTRCGAVLGEAALAAADALWAMDWATFRQRYPGMKRRIVRALYAACTGCGARFDFDREAATFREVQVVFLFEQEPES